MNQTVRYEIGRPADLPRRTITVNRGHTMLHMLQHTPGYMVGSRWQAPDHECIPYPHPAFV